MQRLWFNKTFSSVSDAVSLIRQEAQRHPFYIVTSNTRPRSLLSSVAHEYHVEPVGLTDIEYIDWCLEFCRTHAIDLFWPGKAARLVAEHRQRFAAQGTETLDCAEPQALRLLQDKGSFYQACAADEVPPPDFRLFSSHAEFVAAHAELKSRHAVLCVKPTVSVYGLGFAVLERDRSNTSLLIDGVAYRANLTEFKAGLKRLGSIAPMLLMEHLGGAEYSVDCVAQHGRLLSHVVRMKSADPKQAPLGQQVVAHAGIEAAITVLCQRHRLNHVFNVQFRDGQNGLRLLEINPRMSGGIAKSCLAGPNLPLLALLAGRANASALAVTPARQGFWVGERSLAVELE